MTGINKVARDSILEQEHQVVGRLAQALADELHFGASILMHSHGRDTGLHSSMQPKQPIHGLYHVAGVVRIGSYGSVAEHNHRVVAHHTGSRELLVQLYSMLDSTAEGAHLALVQQQAPQQLLPLCHLWQEQPWLLALARLLPGL